MSAITLQDTRFRHAETIASQVNDLLILTRAYATRHAPQYGIGEFLGSAEAGPRASILFTILAGAKRHHLAPWTYVRDVLLRLSAGETDLEPLLPDRWAANHPEQVLQHRHDESRRRAKRKKETRQRRRAMAAKKE